MNEPAEKSGGGEPGAAGIPGTGSPRDTSVRLFRRQEAFGFSTEELAARIGNGLTTAQVAQWAARGKIPEAHEGVIENWLKSNPISTIGIGRGGKYYETVAAKQIRIALSVARRGYISVLTGAPGAGKTVPLLAELKKRRDLVWVAAMDGMGNKALPLMIGAELGIQRKHGTAAAWFRDIVESLKQTPRVICIDEAHYLELLHFNQLYWVCDLANLARPGSCGIFLVGIPDLVMTIRKTRKVRVADGMGSERGYDLPVLEQFLSRVRWRGSLTEGFDAELAPKQIADRLGEVSGEVTARILELCGNSLKKLSGRRIEALCDNIKWRLNAGQAVTVELVNEAAGFTLG